MRTVRWVMVENHETDCITKKYFHLIALCMSMICSSPFCIYIIYMYVLARLPIWPVSCCLPACLTWLLLVGWPNPFLLTSFVYLSIYGLVCLSVYVFATYPSIFASVHLSIYMYVYDNKQRISILNCLQFRFHTNNLNVLTFSFSNLNNFWAEYILEMLWHHVLTHFL